MHKSVRSLIVIAAAASATLFASCMNDSDEWQISNTRYTGALSTLDSTNIDPSLAMRQWVLPVDTADGQELQGNCMSDAWLGDSIGVNRDSVVSLYTNTHMGGRTATAAEMRAEGIFLGLDTTIANEEFYTHYRVDIECRYK